jgi:hypothetical protein
MTRSIEELRGDVEHVLAQIEEIQTDSLPAIDKMVERYNRHPLILDVADSLRLIHERALARWNALLAQLLAQLALHEQRAPADVRHSAQEERLHER